MTSTSVVVNEHDEITIVCPHCRRSKQTPVAPFKNLQRPLKVKCACEYAFTVSLVDDASDAAATLEPVASGLTSSGEMPEGAAPGTADDEPIHNLMFTGSTGTLFGIYAMNLLLMLCTLGLYRFWAKTRIREYLFGQTEFAGDRFAYHGTGKELFVGTLRAGLIFGLPYWLLNNVPTLLNLNLMVQGVSALLASALLVILMGVAMVNARRYRLSRTSWRGIRFSFRGRVWDFLKLHLKGSWLSGLTLGLYTPVFMVRKYAFLTEHSYFGSRACSFDGEPRALFWPYLRSLLLSMVTMGLSWFWFLAEKHRYLWGHTRIGKARFQSSVTGKDMLFLKAGNFLLLILSLGLAWPLIKVRNVRFICDHLTLEGPLDLAAIQQEPQVASSTGEGLAGLFDFLDAEFDIG